MLDPGESDSTLHTSKSSVNGTVFTPAWSSQSDYTRNTVAECRRRLDEQEPSQSVLHHRHQPAHRPVQQRRPSRYRVPAGIDSSKRYFADMSAPFTSVDASTRRAISKLFARAAESCFGAHRLADLQFDYTMSTYTALLQFSSDRVQNPQVLFRTLDRDFGSSSYACEFDFTNSSSVSMRVAIDVHKAQSAMRKRSRNVSLVTATVALLVCLLAYIAIVVTARGGHHSAAAGAPGITPSLSSLVAWVAGTSGASDAASPPRPPDV
jgi:hypothetical protein